MKSAGDDTRSAPPRVVIENVRPAVESGRFPIKRVLGEEVRVEADIHADGHDLLAAVLRYRAVRGEEAPWLEVPMEPLPNDLWRARFTVTELGTYEYTIEAWPDPFRSWRRDLEKRIEAGQDVSVELLVGCELIERAGRKAGGADAASLKEWADRIRGAGPVSTRARRALAADLAALMDRVPPRETSSRHEPILRVVVDPVLARFGAWYEMFPRSAAESPGRHGTFEDCLRILDYVISMGFDILYLPPIHPIGTTHRKGPNNATACGPGDPGSPWAIGSREGGHTSIHPALGDLDGFRKLVDRARARGIEVALDIAYQCSPDHPWVVDHPEWFRALPDGSIRYAENPPKVYQDIYPLDFDSPDWRGLWEEMKSVVSFWIGQGVRIFRVDNPHTKPYAFWEWLIAEIKKDHPDVIFLSEAFTRPKVMARLARIGFTQSYTYFAWRNTSWELREYFTELTRTDMREYFRPNLWPNTPDILTATLQTGGRPAFLARLILAATLGASYGIYGPAFELCEHEPLEPGREEYLNSEKYEIRHWDRDRQDSLREVIARVNRIRHENPALHGDWSLRFHQITNDRLIAYTKSTDDRSNTILVVVNVDPHYTHAGFLELPLEELGLDPTQPYQVHDLLGNARYIWNGPRNYVELNPAVMPAHIFRMRRHLARENDFDYFL